MDFPAYLHHKTCYASLESDLQEGFPSWNRSKSIQKLASLKLTLKFRCNYLAKRKLNSFLPGWPRFFRRCLLAVTKKSVKWQQWSKGSDVFFSFWNGGFLLKSQNATEIFLTTIGHISLTYQKKCVSIGLNLQRVALARQNKLHFCGKFCIFWDSKNRIIQQAFFNLERVWYEIDRS